MKRQKFVPILVVAAGLLAYGNSFTGSYFHGDIGSILENPTIRQLWPIWGPLSPPHADQIALGLTVEGRPLINLSLAINYALGGFKVWGYHALNLTVHILAGLTLMGIVRRTLLQPALRDRLGAAANELALAVAILWTVHPLQTESVTYIIQRAESITGLFYLLTLYWFIRGTDASKPRRWYSLSVFACALGMASKEVMVTAPVMVMLYDRAFLSASIREAWRRRWRFYLMLGSTWILLGLVLASGGNINTALKYAGDLHLRWWEYLATEPGVILHYLRLSVWPSPLQLLYDWPIARTWTTILPAAVVVVILLGTTIWAWKKNPDSFRTGTAWGFVGAWFFLILAPSSSVVPLRDPIYEHRMYLSLAAVVSVVVMGAYAVLGRRSLAMFGVLAIGLGILTWRQNRIYQRDPHYSLGFALQKAGRNEEAIEQFELALRDKRDDLWLRLNLGSALFQAGRMSEAITQYERALRIDPNLAAAHYNLGRALAELGRIPEAIRQYEESLRLKPNDEAAHNAWGFALVPLGRLTEAVAHYEEALRIKPDFVEAHYNLGIALEQMDRLPEAITHYEAILRIKPDVAEAHNRLGINFAKLGKLPEAIEHWEQALRINPDYADVHNNLGTALAQLGRMQEAVDHWQQALQVRPDFPEVYFNLGTALELAGRKEDAIQHYARALQLKPDYTAAKNALARLRAGP